MSQTPVWCAFIDIHLDISDTEDVLKILLILILLFGLVGGAMVYAPKLFPQKSVEESRMIGNIPTVSSVPTLTASSAPAQAAPTPQSAYQRLLNRKSTSSEPVAAAPESGNFVTNLFQGITETVTSSLTPQPSVAPPSGLSVSGPSVLLSSPEPSPQATTPDDSSSANQPPSSTPCEDGIFKCIN